VCCVIFCFRKMTGRRPPPMPKSTTAITGPRIVNTTGVVSWFYVGPTADAKRALAIPKLFENPSRRPDVVALGPDGPNDETVRRRFWPHAAIDPH
jgi:hypothetical protein